jgi:protein tyrosine phosphatase type 4A
MQNRTPQFQRLFSLVEYNGLRFVILDCPDDERLPLYVQELKTYQVRDVVRVCEPSYCTLPLLREDIMVHEMNFEDGGTPSETLVNRWCKFVSDKQSTMAKNDAIAVHCVAGLGRVRKPLVFDFRRLC